jgi:hypothetical protein
MGEVTRFPAKRRILDQLGLDRPADQQDIAALDAEIREVNAALRALQARRGNLLCLYRRAAAQYLARGR